MTCSTKKQTEECGEGWLGELMIDAAFGIVLLAVIVLLLAVAYLGADVNSLTN